MNRFTGTSQNLVSSNERELNKDKLQYSIIFPTSSKSNKEKSQVIFLLGWMGSTEKHLSKYSTIYENLGCIVIRYIYMPTYKNVLENVEMKKMEKTSHELLNILKNYQLLKNPILLHTFSNGGAQIYCCFVKKLLNNNCNIIGTISDSGPLRTTVVSFLRALYYSINNIPVYIVASIAILFAFFVKHILHFFGLSNSIELYKEITSWTFTTWPHLFLHSSSDKVCPSKEVECMETLQKNSNYVYIRHYDFKTSPHVFHYKYHTEQYKKLCTDFLQDCIAINEGGDVKSILKDRLR